MQYLILKYGLDLIAFAAVSLCGTLLVLLLLQRQQKVSRISLRAWLFTVGLVPIVLFVAARAGESERVQLWRMLEGIAPTYAQEMQRMGHAHLPDDAPADDPLYLQLIDAEMRWLHVNPAAADIYTFRKDAEGNVILIVDSETDYDHNGRIDGEREQRTEIGERFEETSPPLERAFGGQANFDDEPQRDRWGTWVSAFVPMYDPEGRVEAVLGVDYPAENWVHSILWGRGGPLTGGIVLIIILVSSNAAIAVLRAQISRRRAAEEQLELARRAAETANQAKSEFLANMSHEIRTPMTAILGYTELLLEPELSTESRTNCINIIRGNGEHLLDIINDILDLSKIEAGQMTVERIPCRPAQILHDVESLMRVRAAAKELSLEVRLDGPIPEQIQSDPTRLRQILLNLVGNAIKFTSQGEVRITVRLDRAANRLAFEVTDSGIGMTPEQLARLFRPFTQGDSSTTRIFGGTGLGLVISNRLAHLLGGDITIRSTPAVGSTFIVSIDLGPLDGIAMIDSLPAVSGEPADLPAANAPRIGARILLAEDTQANALLLAHHLQKAGADVTIAENGKIACEQAAETPFDLILMDMQMPVLDGYTATAQLRAAGCKTPIIALTANAMAEDREKCIRAGCTDFLAKPLKARQLLETVAKHLNVKSPATTAAQDDDDISSFLPMFVNTLPKAVRQIQRCIECNDLDELGNAIHRVKGSGGLYGFAAITEAAMRAEQALKSSRALEPALAAIQELIDLLRAVDGYKAAAKEQASPSPAVATT